MEPMTGYDLLQEARKDPNLSTTPFIMVTAKAPPPPAVADVSPSQFAHDRLRRLAGGGESRIERLAVGTVTAAQLLGVNA